MDKQSRERLNKLVTYFLDLSKLCFTGLVIGIVVILATEYQNIIMWAILLLGALSTTLFTMIVNRLLKQ